jgi:hypothetical protein
VARTEARMPGPLARGFSPIGFSSPGRATDSGSCPSQRSFRKRSFGSSRHPTSRFTAPPTDLGRLSGPLFSSSLTSVCYDLARVDLRNQSAFHTGDVAVHVVGSCRSCRRRHPSRRLRPSRAKSWGTCAGSIPAASIVARSPAPLARSHNDFERLLALSTRRGGPTWQSRLRRPVRNRRVVTFSA